MKYFGKVRASAWVDPKLILLLNESGLTLTSFLNRALPIYLDLPEDPRDKLIQEKLDKMVIRLRISYAKEMQAAILESQIENQADLELQEQQSELLDLGDLLQKMSTYAQIEKDLKNKEPSDELWEDLAAIVSSKTGRELTSHELWNQALQWWALPKRRQLN